MDKVDRSIETRFGGIRGNTPNRGTGAWKKTETARYQFETIQNMTGEELAEYVTREDLTVLQRNIAKATLNLLNKRDISIEDIEKQISVFESKPAQKMEVSELPTPKPLIDVKDSHVSKNNNAM